MARPPAPVRALVLLGAGAALFLTVCARHKAAAPPPVTPTVTDAGAPPDAKPEAKPEFFPATKSAGAMYQP